MLLCACVWAEHLKWCVCMGRAVTMATPSFEYFMWRSSLSFSLSLSPYAFSVIHNSEQGTGTGGCVGLCILCLRDFSVFKDIMFYEKVPLWDVSSYWHILHPVSKQDYLHSKMTHLCRLRLLDCWCFTPAGALTSGGRSRVVLENSGCKQQPVEFNPFF